MSKKILIAGGSGLIGKELTVKCISLGYEVIILTRSHKKPKKNVTYITWDPAKKSVSSEIPPVDYVINLAGAGIADKRWTQKRKNEILYSRTESTAYLIDIIPPINTYIGASAVGFYGANPEMNIQEDAKGEPQNFMSHVCMEWEKAHLIADAKSKRQIIFRIGIVLANEGGAFPKLTMPLKFGVGSYMGTGDMIYPWIHINDVVAMLLYAMENTTISGTYNMVAPEPCSQKAIIDAASNKNKIGSIKLPTPKFFLKTMLGEMADTVLMSCHASSAKIEKEGFRFLFPNIDSAITDLMK